MAKMNCWEFLNCGRQPGGEKVEELGICPAARKNRLNGKHGGINAGRACWVVAGTYCWGEVQGSVASKLKNCMECEFYWIVVDEEGGKFDPLP